MDAASVLYPTASNSPASASQAPAAGVAAAQIPAAQQAPVAQPERLEDHAIGQEEARPPPDASLLYGDPVPTHGRVDWREGGAEAASIFPQLATPEGFDVYDADMAERQRFADALSQAGVGRTFASELWTDLERATRKPVATTRQEAVQALTEVYGVRLAEKVATANRVISDFERLHPGSFARLKATGLANDPTFIRKLVRFAEARR